MAVQSKSERIHPFSLEGLPSMYSDKKAIGSGRVEQTMPFLISLDETVDVGADIASPVSDDCGATGNEFTGTIDRIRLDAGDDIHDHLIDPEHKLHIAMTRQ
jgi:hypothetical protein